jgi:conjugal transfer pilus assembly protein TraW
MTTMRSTLLGLFITGFVSCSLAQADSKPAAQSAIGDIVNKSRSVRDQAASTTPSTATPSSAQSIEIATDIANKIPLGSLRKSTDTYNPGMERAADMAATVRIPSLGAHAPNNLLQAPAASSGPSVYIFISQSQSDGDIKSALEVAAQVGATVFLRGILPGSTLDKGALRVQRIAGSMSPIPNVTIDPRPFQQFEVELVPTVVVATSINNYSKVSGTLAVDYAADRLRDHQYGDLGSRGQTLPIVEPDLVEDFKARILSIDWESKKHKATQRMFHSLNIISLPKAVESATRTVDPTVVLANDIAMPDGKLIAVAGSSFNPLKAFGMSRQIVVFDATDPRQLKFAKSIADADLAQNRIAVLITTEVDRDRGMESFKEISQALRPHKIFFLDDTVRERLSVRVVPTVAKSDGTNLQLREIGPESLQ